MVITNKIDIILDGGCLCFGLCVSPSVFVRLQVDVDKHGLISTRILPLLSVIPLLFMWLQVDDDKHWFTLISIYTTKQQINNRSICLYAEISIIGIHTHEQAHGHTHTHIHAKPRDVNNSQNYTYC